MILEMTRWQQSPICNQQLEFGTFCRHLYRNDLAQKQMRLSWREHWTKIHMECSSICMAILSIEAPSIDASYIMFFPHWISMYSPLTTEVSPSHIFIYSKNGSRYN